jgi:methyl-accepting chemotaxis protein
MSEQWRTDLERLRECYPSISALAEAAGLGFDQLRQVIQGTNAASEEVKTALREHRETLQEEHVVAKEIGHYALQMIEGYRNGGYTDEQLTRMKETLQDKIDKLCDD